MAQARTLSAEDAALLAEANRVNYRLRSTFFYRKLKEYETLVLPSMVAALLPVEHLYSWNDRHEWGIGEDAFRYVDTHPELRLFEIFCHPKLLREHHQLLAYYRHVAALSQKSITHLVGINVKRFESGASAKVALTAQQSLTLARLFNEHVTLIVDASIESLTREELHGIMLASTGAQIDGSWRNAVGVEAEKVVQRLLVNEAKERGLLAALISRADVAAVPYVPSKLEDQLGRIHEYRGILLANQTSILFASEPDVSLLDERGETVCAIEVKGGADTAGALERYGAAKKSFEEVRRQTPGVSTILVASCMTTEGYERIRQDPLISSYYNLTELLRDDSPQRSRFMQQVFSLLGTGLGIDP